MKYRGLTLDPFQQQAIEDIQSGHSVIVSAPTGTGKTLIADYLIEHILEQGGEIVYTSPIKALSNQKYRQYAQLFGPEHVGLVTGDLVINRDAPVRIMTTEILRNMLLEGAHLPGDEPHERRDELDKLQAVIIDEIHFLADPDRGTVWEELLIYLPTRVRILGLSATLSNLEEFTDWLSQVRQTPVKIIFEPKRTVPLKFFMANNDTQLVSVDQFTKQYGKWRNTNKGKNNKRQRGRGGRRQQEQTRHVDIINMLHNQSYPALYFIFSRALVERLAYDLAVSPTGKKLAPTHITSKIKTKLDTFAQTYPDVLTSKLRHMYMQGIAFHHAGLHVLLKGLVEELYEASLIRVLYCTSTFALGINMPARTVIFDSLSKFNGQEIAPLTVREFMQMAGRAGRRGIDTEGDIIMRQDFHNFYEIQSLLGALLQGSSEPVTSSFNLSFHTVVHLLERFEAEHIRGLLQRSFKAYRSRQYAQRLRQDIDQRSSRITNSPLGRLNPDQLNAKQRKNLRQLTHDIAESQRALLEEERPRIWEDFLRKAEFLRTYGYVDDHYHLMASAKIMKHIKIEEVLLTELILNGVLEPLNDDELFGLMCGLVSSLPRKVRLARPDKKWKPIFEATFDVLNAPCVIHAQQLMQQESTCTFDLMPLGERWARGESLSSILTRLETPTDLSGDLVGAFRRAKDMLSQLRDVYEEDEAFQKRIRQLMRKVTRDEVQVLY